VLVVGLLGIERGRHRQLMPIRPHVVARLTTGQTYDMTAGLGALWVTSIDRNQLLRIDPRAHRVLGRIDVGRLPTGVATADGAVWVIAHAGDPTGAAYALTRVDPAGDRATRLRLDRAAGHVLGAGGLPRLHATATGLLWALDAYGGVRLDPQTGAVSRRVRWPLPGGIGANGYALTDTALWVHAANGRLLRLDPRTGATRGGFSTAARAHLVAPASGVVLLLGADGRLTRLDPTTARPVWTAQLSGAPGEDSSARTIALADNTLWVVREDSIHSTERLIRVDPTNGRVLGSSPLRDIGAESLTVAGDDLWYAVGFQTIALAP
jgi:outer membrane protein assembly factor BamB